MRLNSLTLAALQLAALTAASPVAATAEDAAPKQWTPRSMQPSKHLRPALEPRADPGFAQGQPFDGTKGAPILAGTNKQLDLQNPDNLGAQSTDSGLVTNLKWSFSDSKTRLLNGGWVREQVVTDLPPSKDIAGAQQHVVKGAYRELHWHRTAEWGYLQSGEILIYATNEEGQNTATRLTPGDVWYFPKGVAHGLQGIADSEYLLIFDDGNFDATGTTFNLVDWLRHIPKSAVAKSLGVNETALFKNLPETDPYIFRGQYTDDAAQTPSPNGKLEGNSSYVFHKSQQKPIKAAGGGGTVNIIDSTNFPIAKTIASAVVTLKPGAVRELHWHPEADEWVYFLSGNARATVFLGGSNARTFDFSDGDTAVFPISSGHYVENISKDKDLVWIEIYKAPRVSDISLQQWLALTPAHVVAAALNTTVDAIKALKTEKQLIIA